MKKHFYTLLILSVFVGFIACGSKKIVAPEKLTVEGSWRLIEENEKPVDRKQIKHYTEKNFIWHTMAPDDLIAVAVAGEYTLSGDTLVENIQMVSPNYTDFMGKKAYINIKIGRDTLYKKTFMRLSDRILDFTEKWVRIK